MRACRRPDVRRRGTAVAQLAIPGQPEITKQGIVEMAADQFRCGLGSIDRTHLQTVNTQPLFEEGADAVFVVQDQDPEAL